MGRYDRDRRGLAPMQQAMAVYRSMGRTAAETAAMTAVAPMEVVAVTEAADIDAF